MVTVIRTAVRASTTPLAQWRHSVLTVAWATVNMAAADPMTASTRCWCSRPNSSNNKPSVAEADPWRQWPQICPSTIHIWQSQRPVHTTHKVSLMVHLSSSPPTSMPPWVLDLHQHMRPMVVAALLKDLPCMCSSMNLMYFQDCFGAFPILFCYGSVLNSFHLLFCHRNGYGQAHSQSLSPLSVSPETVQNLAMKGSPGGSPSSQNAASLAGKANLLKFFSNSQSVNLPNGSVQNISSNAQLLRGTNNGHNNATASFGLYPSSLQGYAGGTDRENDSLTSINTTKLINIGTDHWRIPSRSAAVELCRFHGIS